VALPISRRRQALQVRPFFFALRSNDCGERQSAANEYLNNLVEQDHQAIKQRFASKAAFNSFKNAAIPIDAVEIAHRICKGQFSFGRGRRRHSWSRKTEWAMALT